MTSAYPAQTIESLNIGAVPIGAFQDGKVRRLIGDEAEPFYIIAAGKIG